MNRGLLLLAALLYGTGCHLVLPFESAVTDSGTGSADSSPGEQDAAAPAPDVLPDAAPGFDLGGTRCNGLHVGPEQLLVSAKGGVPATQPAIVALEDRFYVAFVKGPNVVVRMIDPFDSAPTPIIKFSNPSYPAFAPQITFNPDAGKLALAWHEKIGADGCASRLMIKETTPDWDIGPECDLTGAAFSGYGYGPVSLTYDGSGEKEYILASPVALNCSGHIKPTVHFVRSGDCNPLQEAYVGTLEPLSATFHPVLVTTSNPERHYQMVRLVGPDSVLEPTEIDVLLQWLANGTWSGHTLQLAAGGALLNRPALVSAGEGIVAAWTTSSHNLRIYSEGPPVSDLTIKDPTATDRPLTGRDPALAHRTANNMTVIAFSRVGPNTEGSWGIDLGLIGSEGLSIQVPIVRAPDQSSFNPRTPAVAASKNGFGVVWVDNSTGQPEVYFKWVGCTP